MEIEELNLSSYIKIYDNFLPENIHNNYLKYVNSLKDFEPGELSGDSQTEGKTDKKIRDVLVFECVNSDEEKSFTNLHWTNFILAALTNKIENYFNNVAKQDNLTSLNTAFAKEGAYIYIPKNTEVEKPIQIINFTTGSEAATMIQPRNLIVAEQNAHVQIIERHQSLTKNAILTNSVTEVFADRHATVDYYKIQNDEVTASLVDNTYIEQKSESTVSVHTFSFGGKITRNNLNFYQKGEHINSILKGITILEGKQHVDHHTLVHHIEPNCESHQDYKGIYNERSTGVFNGKVVVEKEAQKTNAYQQNNNVLVSDKATINAKPQLEIFADDVRCSHGCTIGQLDEQALFYMQQRGIPIKEARGLLMYAFANTVLESVKIPEIKSRITKIIANKLGVNIGFEL